jgi:hypothetical protein
LSSGARRKGVLYLGGAWLTIFAVLGPIALPIIAFSLLIIALPLSGPARVLTRAVYLLACLLTGVAIALAVAGRAFWA